MSKVVARQWKGHPIQSYPNRCINCHYMLRFYLKPGTYFNVTFRKCGHKFAKLELGPNTAEQILKILELFEKPE